ncbi:hypothetical protein [Lactobacillus porci]|uniref:hypothetical protein n=1 Tax=Lactobacillus porci TaxID=2012477 RepID=UPI0012B33191|nr:hypothetical protein [Lactobacillus porci]
MLLEVDSLSEAETESAVDLTKLALTDALADALWLALVVSAWLEELEGLAVLCDAGT